MSGQSTIDIDVYFHVIYKTDGTGNVSDQMISDQMDVLNKAFGGEAPSYNNCDGGSQPAGLDTPFRFTLKGTTRTLNDAWFECGECNNAEDIASSLRVGDCSTLNMFVLNIESLGFATYPNGCDNSALEYDYSFLRYTTLPNGGLASTDEGDTATHEVGHWLGLAHTFEGGCSGDGDGVDDTPAVAEENYGCPSNVDSCPSDAGLDAVENFMDYTDDCCMYTFSSGQIDRMQALAATYRGLTASPSPPTSTPAPVASPTATEAPVTSPTADDDDDYFYDDDDDDTASCVDEGDRFFWGKLRGSRKSRSCTWLQGNSNIAGVCKNRVNYGKISGILYEPPQVACASTCDACDECYQNSKSKFYWYFNKRKNRRVIKRCSWLARQSVARLLKICSSNSSDAVYPSAATVCPLTCGTNGCSS